MIPGTGSQAVNMIFPQYLRYCERQEGQSLLWQSLRGKDFADDFKLSSKVLHGKTPLTALSPNQKYR